MSFFFLEDSRKDRLVFLMNSVCLNVCFVASYHILQAGGHFHNDDGVTLLESQELDVVFFLYLCRGKDGHSAAAQIVSG